MSFPLATDIDTNIIGKVETLTVGLLKYDTLDPPILTPTTALLSVRRVADFTIPANTGTLLPFDNIDYQLNITKNSNTRYTVPSNGAYRITFFATVNAPSNNPSVGFSIYKNGSSLGLGTSCTPIASQSATMSVSIDGIVNLTAGNYIEVNSYSFTHPALLKETGFVGFNGSPCVLTIEKLL